MSVEDEEKFIKKVLKKENDLFIVAEIDGEIIGSLSFFGKMCNKLFGFIHNFNS